MIYSRLGVEFPATSTLPTMMPFLYQTSTIASVSARQVRVLRQIRHSSDSKGGKEFSVDGGDLRCLPLQDRLGSAIYDSQEESNQTTRFDSLHASDNVGGGELKAYRKVLLNQRFPGSPSQCPENLSRRLLNNHSRSPDHGGIFHGAVEKSHCLNDIDMSVTGMDDFEIVDDEIAKNKSLWGSYERNEQPPDVTDPEKSAFDKIFKDIFERRANQHSTQTMQSYQAARRERMGHTALQDPCHFAESSLKPAANILDLQNHRGQALNERKFLQRHIRLKGDTQIAKTREAERDRVEASMRAAKTDFELWKVMEVEVFSLITKLGLEDTLEPLLEPLSCQNGKRTRKKKGKNTVPATSEEPSNKSRSAMVGARSSLGNPALHDPVPPLQIYGPLYPSYLLLGLRLLDRSFSRPSPLTLALLPKIKSLGHISQVLGATTQFYNELLHIYRFRHDDFEGMLRLLEEMESSSLDMDKDTLAIVRAVYYTQYKVKQGEQGISMQSLWALPKFARGKFNTWVTYLSTNLREKEQARQGGRRQFKITP